MEQGHLSTCMYSSWPTEQALNMDWREHRSHDSHVITSSCTPSILVTLKSVRVCDLLNDLSVIAGRQYSIREVHM